MHADVIQENNVTHKK